MTTQRIQAILSLKPARTMALVIVLAALPLVIPGIRGTLTIKGQPYKAILPNPRQLVSFKSSRSAPTFIPQGRRTELSSTDAAATHPEDFRSEVPIDDATHALDHFYAALARTEAREGPGITRISHYGDSPITSDAITGVTRRLLQRRFGDAGHGFILPDKPWAWYNQQSLGFQTSGNWPSESLSQQKLRDGSYGLGGVSFQTPAGRMARFTTSQEDTGNSLSLIDVYYLMQPGGGEFRVSVNDAPGQVVSTNSENPRSGFYEMRAPQSGTNAFEITTLSDVRIFGAVLENDGPGVVYDSLGISGCFAEYLVTAMNKSHWTEQLRHRNPDLVILNFGTNESNDSDEDRQSNEADLSEVIRRIRSALPEVSILIVSPLDRGRHAPGGEIVTWESIPHIVEMQRRVAHETGCAFFDMYKSMGGEGTMARWYSRPSPLVLADLTHPSADGGLIIGSLTYRALTNGYAGYLARTNSQNPKTTNGNLR